MTLVVRPMDAGDLDCMLAIARDSPEAPQWPRREYEQMLLGNSAALVERCALVARNGDTLAGFAATSLLPSERLSELEAIVVRRNLRRQGIGTALLAASMEYAARRGAACMRLELRESNTAAKAFYRRHGFYSTGLRRLYYRDPAEDALLLEATLALDAENWE